MAGKSINAEKGPSCAFWWANAKRGMHMGGKREGRASFPVARLLWGVRSLLPGGYSQMEELWLSRTTRAGVGPWCTLCGQDGQQELRADCCF